MNTDNVRDWVILDLLRDKHTLSGAGIAASALIGVRGTTDPATELALLLDTALDYLDAALSATGIFDAHLERLETELRFKELVDPPAPVTPKDDQPC